MVPKVLRVLFLRLALGPFLVPCGCGSFFAEAEPLRIQNWNDLDERQLGLSRTTSIAEAVRSAKVSGLTGVRTDTYLSEPEGLVLGALGADYQTRVQVFENDRYVQSVTLAAGGVLPYGVVPRLARSRGQTLLIVLYRDPMELTSPLAPAHGPRLEVFRRHDGGFTPVKTFPLDGLRSATGGIASPIFVGHDLDEGVIFLARDNEGAVWKNAYLMSLSGGECVLKELPLDEAARCSCVRDYIYGGDVETLWGE